MWSSPKRLCEIMEDTELCAIASMIEKRIMFANRGRHRAFMSVIRQIGDELGEPILLNDEYAPQHFVRVMISSGSLANKKVLLAMSPAAAKTILSQG